MTWIERYRKAVIETFGKPISYDDESEDEPLPHTRTNPTLNTHITEIIDEFKNLIEKAKSYGLDIKLTPNSTTSLELYFHDDYPDMILVDKEELGL